jgi:hypothetical protein
MAFQSIYGMCDHCGSRTFVQMRVTQNRGSGEAVNWYCSGCLLSYGYAADAPVIIARDAAV